MSDRVVVVGAGVIGLACAHHLTAAGLQVTVLDRATIGGACSLGNCGYVCPSHTLPLTEPGAVAVALKSLFQPRAAFRVRPSLRPALWKWMAEFARRCNHRSMMAAAGPLHAMLESSLAEYEQLMAAEGFACEWRQDGLLYVFRTQHAFEHFAAVDRMLTEQFDVGARRIEGVELPSFDAALRPGLAGAYHYERDASLRPDLLNRAWAQRLRERGVAFVEDCRVDRIERTGERVVALESTQGRFEAEQFVFAIGAWSSQLASQLGCRIPVEPGKGYSVTMARPSICPSHPMIFHEDRVAVSPFEDGYRLGSMMEFAGFDSSIAPHRIRQLCDAARPYLVEPVAEPELERWYGWRPMTWDSLPIVGPVPNISNAQLATGHNMLGVTLAPATGRLIAELLLGRRPHIDPRPYSPARF